MDFDGDLCLNNFFVGVDLAFKTTQPSPSTLWSGGRHFCGATSITVFSNGATMVFSLDEQTPPMHSMDIFP